MLSKFKFVNKHIRCYRECKHNTFHRSNCGQCTRYEIYVTDEGCMDWEAPRNNTEETSTSTDT